LQITYYSKIIFYIFTIFIKFYNLTNFKKLLIVKVFQ